MKKITLALLTLMCIGLLSASHLTPIDFKGGFNLMYGGEIRARAIMYNDLAENDGGWLDNRLQLNLAANLSKTTSVGWGVEIGNIIWGEEEYEYPWNTKAGFGSQTPKFETRELYIDYQMNWMDLKIRTGQQYWNDHRSLILDDYFSGITADLNISGIPTELGLIKYYEGDPNKLDDAHVAFANFMFKAPVDWGITAMFGQYHDANEADIWVIPYFMLNFEPVTLDLTAVLNHQMYKVAGEDESDMGIAFAAKVEADLGFKPGLDFLYVTEEGVCTLSPFHQNGLYLFGNNLPYDDVQIHGWVYAPYDEAGQAYMSIVGKLAYPLNEKTDICAAVGMASWDDPMGMEFNVSLDYRINDFLSLNPVVAVGQSGKAIDSDENMVYMLGGLLKAEF